MKRTLLLFLLLITGICNAQIVNIPDAAFKATLVSANTSNMSAINNAGNYIVIDANNDGEIQVSEAQAVFELKIFGVPAIISCDGILSFTNLKKLDLGISNLISLDLSGLTSLEDLWLNCNSLENVNLDGATGLKTISTVGSNLMTGLDISDAVNLVSFTVSSSNSFLSLDFSNLPNLELIEIDGILETINISGLPKLKTFIVWNNKITSPLDFSGSPLIETIRCLYNFIPSINVANLQHLTNLNCSGNLLQELILGDLPNLTTLNCGKNQLDELILDGVPKLINLTCDNNLITSLDASACPFIDTILAKNNPIYYVNIKNGENKDMGGLDLSTIAGGIAVCIDEGEEAYIGGFSTLPLSNLRISNYCTFVPGGDYNTITGTFSFDANNNGCDSSDMINDAFAVHISDGTNSGTSYSTDGNYNFYTQSGSFVVTPVLPPGLFTVTPPSATINLATVNNSITAQNFCLTANGVHPDLAVIIVPVVPARPGFDAVYKIIYGNKGNQVLSGSVAFNFNDAVLDYLSSTTPPASSATGTLTWNFTNLKPFEYKVVTVTLNVNGPMETPPVNIDDVLAFTASVTPLTGDDTPADNTFDFNQVVVGSFDPNDITCLEGETVNPEKIGDYLHYNINFENTGTAPAEFIVVKNVIDATQFDISSLQLIDASHNVEVKVTGNKAEFIFDNINLAGTGKGNVVFKIKTLDALAVNDEVNQKADIFFDYNWPIATNDAATIFAVLSNDSFQKDPSVKVYPNPASSVINLTAVSEIQSVQLYDAQGRVLETMVSGNENSVTLDISNRASGLYFVKVITEHGSKVEKVIKK